MRLRDVVMARLEDTVDCGAQGAGHLVFAAVEDGGPWGIEEDVTDAGLAMQENRDTTVERFDGGDTVALNRRHEEEMGLRIELFEVVVGDETVEVDAVAYAE